MSNYQYSFSGSDVRAVAWFSVFDKNKQLIVTPAIELTSLTTLSISVHESKSEVRSLGKKNVSGHTSSIRKIAGSLIFNIINYHPLRILLEEYQKIFMEVGPWRFSQDYRLTYPTPSYPKKLTLPTTLPPFNILLYGVTELNNLVDGNSLLLPDGTNSVANEFIKMNIFGIELIDDNTTFSVNNILTENTYTFVASNYSILENSNGVTSLDENIDIENIIYEQIDTNMATEPDYNLIKELTNEKSSQDNITRIA